MTLSEWIAAKTAENQAVEAEPICIDLRYQAFLAEELEDTKSFFGKKNGYHDGYSFEHWRMHKLAELVRDGLGRYVREKGPSSRNIFQPRAGVSVLV